MLVILLTVTTACASQLVYIKKTNKKKWTSRCVAILSELETRLTCFMVMQWKGCTHVG